MKIKLYCSPKWSWPQLNYGWENSINRRRPSSLLHTAATHQLKEMHSFLGERERERSSHTLQKKIVFKVSIFGKHFHIFIFFLHCTMISELLSLDEGGWVFSLFGFLGEKYSRYCYVICLSSSDPIDKWN